MQGYTNNYKFSNGYLQWLILIISCVLVGINIVRVVSIPLTFDEAVTFLDYVSGSYKNILTCNPSTANNHILNSLLAKSFTQLFHSQSQIVLRLPNVLAQILYICSTCYISHLLFKEKKWILSAFLLFNFNPFLFEFWGLCRGYGLSLALMMAGIAAYLQYFHSSKSWAPILSIGCSILAVYSNFALLNYYVAVVGVMIICSSVFKNSCRQFLKREAPILLLSVVIVYYLIAEPLRALHANQQFYYGGDSGFVKDTVYTLIYESLFLNDRFSFIGWVVTIIVVTVTIVAGVYWISQLVKRRNEQITLGFLLWMLLVIPVFSTTMQHVLFGTKFLIERTALFIYPLFILQVIYFLYYLQRKHALAYGVTLLFTLTLLLVFVFQTNTTATRTWTYDKNNLTVINRMTKPDRSVKVKLYWLFTYSFKYYQHTKYADKLQHIELRWEYPPTGTQYDYYYIHKDEMDIVPPGYIEDTSFFEGKYVLLKRKN